MKHPLMILAAIALLGPQGCTDYTEDFEYHDAAYYAKQRGETVVETVDSPAPKPKHPSELRAHLVATNGYLNVGTEEGEFRIAADSESTPPRNLVQALPEDPTARFVSHVTSPKAVLATIATEQTGDDAYMHYLSGIQEKDWTVQAEFELAGRRMITATRSDKRMTLTFQAMEEETQVTVVMTTVDRRSSAPAFPPPGPE